jgi:hypothetical protein
MRIEQVIEMSFNRCSNRQNSRSRIEDPRRAAIDHTSNEDSVKLGARLSRRADLIAEQDRPPINSHSSETIRNSPPKKTSANCLTLRATCWRFGIIPRGFRDGVSNVPG